MSLNSNNSAYAVTGMHCQGCATKIQAALSAVPGITQAEVTFDPPRARITHEMQLDEDALHRAVRSAGDYDIVISDDAHTQDAATHASHSALAEPKESLYPLLLIVGFIAGVTVLVAVRTGVHAWSAMMGNFMAGFFIVFGFFKLLDPRGFVQTYRTYDLLAKAIPPWGWVYPFVEVALGAAYLLRLAPRATNLITLVLMVVGALGVARALLNKQRIRCACLGTALNLPMTTVTLVEDLAMAAMAGLMLLA